MILTAAASVREYCAQILCLKKRWHRKIIPRIITAILTCNGDPHFANIARTVVTEKRNRSTVKRFFGTKHFKSRSDYRNAYNEVIHTIKRTLKRLSRMPWFIILDGTSTKRGGFTKIMNAIKYRFKDKNKKGKSTKAHMFLMGILLLPNGMRIPLPRMSYYTREYCAATGRTHVSIVKLAVAMIEQAMVPKKTDVIVLADEYFEGKDVHAICTKLGYSYIMPMNSTRCFADTNGNRLPGKTVHTRGLHLPRKHLIKIRFVCGREDTASYRRLSSANLNKTRVYSAYAEVRFVAGLGNVLLTYSHKKKKVNGKKADTFRVLVSNNLDFSAAMVIEYYELRWQIELFFREMKSVIGFDRFRGSDFQAFERYIDVMLMTFLFLECHRNKLIEKYAISRKQKAAITRMRAQGIIEMFRREVEHDSADHLMKLSNRGGRKEMKNILQSLLDIA
jgi:hypothetical protein